MGESLFDSLSRSFDDSRGWLTDSFRGPWSDFTDRFFDRLADEYGKSQPARERHMVGQKASSRAKMAEVEIWLGEMRKC